MSLPMQIITLPLLLFYPASPSFSPGQSHHNYQPKPPSRLLPSRVSLLSIDMHLTAPACFASDVP